METWVRLPVFVAVLLAMLAWETFTPRSAWSVGRGRRLLRNLGMGIAGTVTVRLLFPVAAVGVAAMAREHGWGLFNAAPVPPAIVVAASLMILDLVIYAQHRLFHHSRLLWRLHRVHHTDLDLDTGTALRFHPLEIAVSMAIKMAVVAALGAPPAAVVAFEVILNGMALFNHGNVRMPHAVDRLLRLVVVTPDMHRVHHSARREETDSNYGFNLSLWDRAFSSYRAAPEAGYEGMTIGLETWRNAPVQTLPWLLLMPFQRT